MMKPKASFTRLILSWYKENGRRFPWREKTDPYQILIAEIMLQRTKADQVVTVYEEFLKEFPLIEHLNRATLKQVQSYFAKLGLLWRATLVKKMALEVITKYNGKIPSNRDELLSLPSIGDYIADAVLSFAFGEDRTVIDVNVCRVIGRLFGLEWKGEARRNPVFRKILNECLPKGRSKEFNWAIIDYASLVCLPRKPLCPKCSLNRICEYVKAISIK